MVVIVIAILIVTVVDILNKHNNFVPMSLTLSICVYLDPTLTQVLHHKDVACTSTLTTSIPNIWYQSERLFNLLSTVINSHTTFMIWFFLKKQRRERHS